MQTGHGGLESSLKLWVAIVHTECMKYSSTKKFIARNVYLKTGCEDDMIHDPFSSVA
jgi:hypothetical protein